MANESASFYGRILIVLGVMVVAGLYNSENSARSPTGFVVDEGGQSAFFDVKTFEGDTRTCADGSLYGECSTILKPGYCVYGELVDYCELCGCDSGLCQNHECVSP